MVAKTTFDSEGNIISEEEIDSELYAPTPTEIFNKLDPVRADAILKLAGGLISQAGVVWDATYAMSNDDPSKAALVPIAEQLLEAALPLLEA